MYGIIYRVANIVNGNIYIGQTKTALAKRWSKHCSDARSGAGWVLAAAIRKHGKEAFVLDVVEECSGKEALNEAEISWIAKLHPTYNSCGGGGSLGSHSNETKAKISLRLKGKPLSEKHKQHISQGLVGREVTEVMREKLRISLQGRYLRKKPITQAEREGLAGRNRARRMHPIRTDLLALYDANGTTTRNEKIALAAKHGFESGTRKRLVGKLNPMYGKERPEEVKQALSQKMSGVNNPYFGKEHSEETRAKMKAAHAARAPVTCPHCGKEGHVNTMKRWHFANCRDKK